MPAPLPWLYEFWAEEGLRRGQPPLRPVVPVSLSFVEATPPQFSLVDSGSEHVLASSWLADAVWIDLSHAEDRVTLGIGGQTVEARFAEVELGLHPSLEDDAFMDWRSDVGFVPGWRAPLPVLLGQVGFFDQFTVTIHRGAAALAIEGWEAFDERFGTLPTPDRL